MIQLEKTWFLDVNSRLFDNRTYIGEVVEMRRIPEDTEINGRWLEFGAPNPHITSMITDFYSFRVMHSSIMPRGAP